MHRRKIFQHVEKAANMLSRSRKLLLDIIVYSGIFDEAQQTILSPSFVLIIFFVMTLV
jgi:hypothetical protein